MESACSNMNLILFFFHCFSFSSFPYRCRDMRNATQREREKKIIQLTIRRQEKSYEQNNFFHLKQLFFFYFHCFSSKSIKSVNIFWWICCCYFPCFYRFEVRFKQIAWHSCVVSTKSRSSTFFHTHSFPKTKITLHFFQTNTDTSVSINACYVKFALPIANIGWAHIQTHMHTHIEILSFFSAIAVSLLKIFNLIEAHLTEFEKQPISIQSKPHSYEICFFILVFFFYFFFSFSITFAIKYSIRLAWDVAMFNNFMEINS